MADTSDVDAAVIALVQSDAALMALCPDGVYWEIATLGAVNYVIVAQLDHDEKYILQGRAFERVLYLVKAVTQGSSGTTVRQAAARIFGLLQDAHVNQRLAAVGYHTMLVERVERVRYTEVDETSDLRWQHRGGQFEVLVAPTVAP